MKKKGWQKKRCPKRWFKKLGASSVLTCVKTSLVASVRRHPSSELVRRSVRSVVRSLVSFGRSVGRFGRFARFEVVSLTTKDQVTGLPSPSLHLFLTGIPHSHRPASSAPSAHCAIRPSAFHRCSTLCTLWRRAGQRGGGGRSHMVAHSTVRRDNGSALEVTFGVAAPAAFEQPEGTDQDTKVPSTTVTEFRSGVSTPSTGPE